MGRLRQRTCVTLQRRLPRHSWRRNQFAVALASFVGFTGFTLVMPFLPLYFEQLGVTDVSAIVLWSGVSLGVTPAMTAVLGPLWGRLADRFGHKVMIERSLLGFVVMMTSMAFVTQPWHIVALRVVQGLFSGYGALTISVAAGAAPEGRMASAIGVVHSAQRLGPALGPVIGGAVAQLVGLRHAFLVAGAFYLVAFVLVLVLYQEPRTAQVAQEAPRGARPTIREIFALQHFVLMMVVVFGVQLVDRSFGPILPIFMIQIGTPVSEAPLVSGIIFSLAAGAGVLGHHFASRLLAIFSLRSVIAGSATVGAAAAVMFALAGRLASVLAAAPLLGLSVGVAVTGAYTAAGRVTPPGAHGTAFGLLSSAALAGLAISPIFAGLLGAVSIRAVFALDAAGLLVIAGLTWRLMEGNRQADGQAAPQRESEAPNRAR